MIKKMLAIFFFSFTLTKVVALPQDIYSFSTVQRNNQFVGLTNELRCLVCPNQDLKDSEAPLAQDLRSEIATMVKQGQSSHQIKQYLVKRYGDYILFKPPFMYSTYILWLAPFLMLILFPLTLYFFIKRFRS